MLCIATCDRSIQQHLALCVEGAELYFLSCPGGQISKKHTFCRVREHAQFACSE